MRYYYDAENQNKRKWSQENLYEIREKKKRQTGLVIEEDTVYEIDEVCMRQGD